MLRVTDLAHLIVGRRLQAGDIAIDATVGNGYDTVMLADGVGPTGRVYGFDVQATALARTRVRLGDRRHVTLFETGHERMADVVPMDAHGRVAAIMFNLGYLPGADKRITTVAAATVAALASSLTLLAPGGIVTLVLYRGHDAGDEEAEAVRAMAGALPGAYCVHGVKRLNGATAAPELLTIERSI